MQPELDPRRNPYAPPGASTAIETSGVRPADGASRYDGERRSVWLLLLLCVVTLGVYPGVWFLRRRAFLDSLDASKKLGGLPIAFLVTSALLFLVAIAQAPDPIVRAAQAVDGIMGVILAFRVAAILRSDFARTGRLLPIWSASVFFFGILYLQHVINRAADTPPRVARSAAT